MTKDTAKKLGLVAAALILPGGFILGAALVADHRRKKAAARTDDAKNSAGLPSPTPSEERDVP